MKMRKLISAATLAVLFCLLAGSCAGRKDLKDFAKRVADNVYAGNMDSIKALYPEAAFDAVGFDGPFSEIKVGDEVEPGVVRVYFDTIAWIDVARTKEGHMLVKNSLGIASFPKLQQKIVKGTGMIDETATDNILTERLNDPDYINWLKDKAYEDVAGGLTLSLGKARENWGYSLDGMPCECSSVRVPCTITNDSGKRVSGKDYTIRFSYMIETCSDGSSPPAKLTGSHKGIDLEPGASGTVTLAVNGYDLKNPTIIFNANKEEYFQNEYQPKGTEYSEYLKMKGK